MATVKPPHGLAGPRWVPATRGHFLLSVRPRQVIPFRGRPDANPPLLSFRAGLGRVDFEKAQTNPGPGLGREPDSLFIPGRLEVCSGDRSATGNTARCERSWPRPPRDSRRGKSVRGDSWPSPCRGRLGGGPFPVPQRRRRGVTSLSQKLARTDRVKNTQADGKLSSASRSATVQDRVGNALQPPPVTKRIQKGRSDRHRIGAGGHVLPGVFRGRHAAAAQNAHPRPEGGSYLLDGPQGQRFDGLPGQAAPGSRQCIAEVKGADAYAMQRPGQVHPADRRQLGDYGQSQPQENAAGVYHTRHRLPVHVWARQVSFHRRRIHPQRVEAQLGPLGGGEAVDAENASREIMLGERRNTRARQSQAVHPTADARQRAQGR
jgi:hypothetical protein